MNEFLSNDIKLELTNILSKGGEYAFDLVLEPTEDNKILWNLINNSNTPVEIKPTPLIHTAELRAEIMLYMDKDSLWFYYSMAYLFSGQVLFSHPKNNTSEVTIKFIVPSIN